MDYNDDVATRRVGFGVQSLLGIYAVPPYGHNGACETIACVVGDVKHRTANGSLPDKLSASRRSRPRWSSSSNRSTCRPSRSPEHRTAPTPDPVGAVRLWPQLIGVFLLTGYRCGRNR